MRNKHISRKPCNRREGFPRVTRQVNHSAGHAVHGYGREEKRGEERKKKKRDTKKYKNMQLDKTPETEAVPTLVISVRAEGTGFYTPSPAESGVNAHR